MLSKRPLQGLIPHQLLNKMMMYSNMIPYQHPNVNSSCLGKTPLHRVNVQKLQNLASTSALASASVPAPADTITSLQAAL
ncbi:hypothetical protein L1887_39587 [Cichorium endivia]|nr:hypothetical protein L1887_39587 [Cichorium endivia]